jgi:hypothetical protein
MLTRIMTILMAVTLAGGLLATDSQARGGGGGHGGGIGGGHVGGFGGHFVGTRMSSGFGRGFHGDHRHGGYELGTSCLESLARPGALVAEYSRCEKP